MNQTTNISVIIPNYNHAAYLKQRIDSILNQTIQSFEVIILDDCSTDNSKEIIEQYKNHPNVSQVIYNNINGGSVFKQWQKGIDLSKSKYIWIAESDDYCELNFLEKMIPVLENNVGLAYCRSARVENNKENMNYFWADGLDPLKWKNNYFNAGITEISESLIYRNTIPNASACIFRKDCMDLTLTLSEFKFAGDWLFWINLVRNTSLGFIAETLNYFRFNAQSTRAIKNVNLEILRFKEYFYVINNARSLCKKGKINLSELPKYEWIMDEYWQRRKMFGTFSIIFPAIPKEYLSMYYLYLFKKITNV